MLLVDRANRPGERRRKSNSGGLTACGALYARRSKAREGYGGVRVGTGATMVIKIAGDLMELGPPRDCLARDENRPDIDVEERC